MISRLFQYTALILFMSCTFYSFRGSIPPHIKSIYISPIKNHTIESGASNNLKIQLDQMFIKENVLKLLPLKDSNSQLDITVTSFSDSPYSYDLSSVDSGYEKVNEHRITIKVKVVWFDLINNVELFESEISSWGAYDPNNQDIGQDGIDNDNDNYIDDKDDDEYGPPRESAINIASKKISESIINNIVSTW